MDEDLNGIQNSVAVSIMAAATPCIFNSVEQCV